MAPLEDSTLLEQAVAFEQRYLSLDRLAVYSPTIPACSPPTMLRIAMPQGMFCFGRQHHAAGTPFLA